MMLISVSIFIGLWILISVLFIVVFIPEHRVGKALLSQCQFFCPCGFPGETKESSIEEILLEWTAKTQRRKDMFMMLMLLFIPALLVLLTKDILETLYHKRHCLPYMVGRVGKDE